MLAASTARFAREGYGGNGLAYNEVMVDTQWYVANMPDAVEAFFEYDGYGGAAGVHQQFLDHFGLSAADVPLVLFGGAAADGPWRYPQSGS